MNGRVIKTIETETTINGSLYVIRGGIREQGAPVIHSIDRVTATTSERMTVEQIAKRESLTVGRTRTLLHVALQAQTPRVARAVDVSLESLLAAREERRAIHAMAENVLRAGEVSL